MIWGRTNRNACALMAATLLVVSACGSSSGKRATDPSTPCAAQGKGDKVQTIRVPGDEKTIQAAVCAAHAGDLVLVSAGMYREAVDVTTPNVTIRGVDRDRVILDGGFKLENGIRVLETDGVVVENMTARNYTSNGFFWTGSDYFRGSYLTAYRNGDYGVYAFDAHHGQLDHSYGGGSPDAGFYVGECFTCDVVIDGVLSENNGLGYSGTNSGGDLYIIRSVFRHNRAGIVPNTGSYEQCYPQRETTIIGNLIYANDNSTSPAIDNALLASGNGILAPGGVRNVIERNRVMNHPRTGIGLVPFPESDASDLPPAASTWDQPCTPKPATGKTKIPAADCKEVKGIMDKCGVLWAPKENRVIGNVVEGSGVADIAVGTLDVFGTGETTETLGNCFSDNTYGTTAPHDLETLAPCDAVGHGDWTAGVLDLVGVFLDIPAAPPKDRWKTTPVPSAQTPMPGSVTRAPVRFQGPTRPDLAAIAVPDAPTGT
ncbi:MAG: hypothetical protein ABJC79_06520 [Acidimicrobiia bacterium]